MRPAGQCTCERSVTENKPVDGDACACGKRPAGMPPLLSFSIDRYEQSTDDACIDSCTCEKIEKIDAAVQEGLETDFTTTA